MSILIDGTSGITPLAFSSNLQFTSTGQRILGDFSNATVANRVAFQTSTTNGITRVNAIPNGSSTESGYNFYNSSSVTPSQFGQIFITSSEVTFRSADASTGTFLPMTFYTGGSERMRIDTSGNVGIGTSSPLERLHVVGGPVLVGGVLSALRASTVSLDFSGGAGRVIATGADASSVAPIIFGNATTTNFAERMRIDSSGNVGIGTSSPASFTGGNNGLAVSINGNSGLAILRNAATSGITFDQFQVGVAQAASANYHFIRCYHSVNSAPTPVYFVNGNGDGYFAGNVGIGTSIPATKLDVIAGNDNGVRVQNTSGGISVYIGTTGGVSGFSGTTSNHPYVLFANNAERMRIDASGNVGIGTSSPSYKLHVASGASQIVGWFQNTDASNLSYITVRDKDGFYINIGRASASTAFVGYSDNLLFQQGATERMRITDAGEVYIAGTTDRGAYNLQCNGTGVWGAGAYVNGSDARLKEEVADIQSGLDVVAAMRPVTFRYKEDYSKDQSTQPGFIAQELQAAMEGKNYVDGVVQSGPEYLNVAYQNLIPILTKAIQELKSELDELKAKVQ